MSSYSGSGTVSIEWEVRIFKNNFNSSLDIFKNDNDDNNNIYIHIDEQNKIDKFYLSSLEIDLKDSLDEKAKEYILDVYSKKEVIDALMEISYSVSGYYDPGCTSGPPENCYPPEGDEERVVEDAFLYLNNQEIAIEIKDTVKVYDVFEEEINEQEFTPADDYYDYDDRY